jgi:hypothetical protein
MSKHDYTPDQALELLIQKVNERNPALAVEVRAAVNAGRDVQETEQVRKRGGKMKSLSFRRTVPFSTEQALEVALEALKAHFVEQPLFANSVLDDMAQSAFGVVEAGSQQTQSKQTVLKAQGRGEQKTVEIELRTETQLLSDTHLVRTQPDSFRIGRVPAELIEDQKTNVRKLRELFNFNEER